MKLSFKLLLLTAITSASLQLLLQKEKRKKAVETVKIMTDSVKTITKDSTGKKAKSGF